MIQEVSFRSCGINGMNRMEKRGNIVGLATVQAFPLCSMPLLVACSSISLGYCVSRSSSAGVP